jgi:hypothetical protein
VVDPHATELHDWQQHHYLPGYSGGRLHPMLRGTRPNPWGWVVLVAGVLGMVGVLIAIIAGSGDLVGADPDTILEKAVGGLMMLGLSVLATASGWRLLRGRRPPR